MHPQLQPPVGLLHLQRCRLAWFRRCAYNDTADLNAKFAAACAGVGVRHPHAAPRQLQGANHTLPFILVQHPFPVYVLAPDRTAVVRSLDRRQDYEMFDGFGRHNGQGHSTSHCGH